MSGFHLMSVIVRNPEFRRSLNHLAQMTIAVRGGRTREVGRRICAKVFSVDYRLDPEHPHPVAVDDALAAYQALLHDGTAPSDIVFAGESAGGGLAVATLLNARDHGLPLPAAAFVMSPYADLTLRPPASARPAFVPGR